MDTKAEAHRIQPEPSLILKSLGWRAASTPQPLSGGWDNHLWRFSTSDGKQHVLRVYRDGSSPAAARADNEAAAMACARAAGLPVPLNEATAELNGVPVFVQQWVEGSTLLDAIKRRPWVLRSLARQFGILQARLHAVPPAASIRRIAVAGIRSNLADEELSAALERESQIDTFCHLDYHPLNVLAKGGTLVALLDWTNAGVTDRRADLAFTEAALLRVPMPPGPFNVLLRKARRWLHQGWRAGYLSEAGDFPLTPLFQAAAVSGYLSDLEIAVKEGRGWATPADAMSLRAEKASLLKRAGLR